MTYPYGDAADLQRRFAHERDDLALLAEAPDNNRTGPDTTQHDIDTDRDGWRGTVATA